MLAQVFGKIQLPEPLKQGYGGLAGPNGGLVGFLNNLLKLFTLGAGLFTIINIVLAGFEIITSGSEPEKMSKASSKIWLSILGLTIIVASYTLAAVLGWVLFHNTRAILNPKIYGPGALGGESTSSPDLPPDMLE